MNKSFDIDVVIPWVNGADKEWLKEKEKYCHETGDAASAKRFRDYGLMPELFWLIRKNMPYVRTIFLVTWGHVPADLPAEVRVVRHDEFIPQEYLPTFSSHTIELNLHRIHDLAEHFIYFNDDIFPIRTIHSNYFFDKNGRPKGVYNEMPIRYVGGPEIWKYVSANVLSVLNDHFKKKLNVSPAYSFKTNLRNMVAKILYPEYLIGYKSYHTANAYVKSTFEEIWDKEHDVLHETCSHRFRTYTDVSQELPRMWQMLNGTTVAGKDASMVMDINKESIQQIKEVIQQQACSLLCLNDSDMTDDEFNYCMGELKKSFAEIC